MWNVTGTNLQMAEGDYGIALPVTISGITLTENDSIRFTFKTSPNGETVLTKEYANISQNTLQLVLSEAESALLPVGSYYCPFRCSGGLFLRDRNHKGCC